MWAPGPGQTAGDPGLERALERALERTAWAPGLERELCGQTPPLQELCGRTLSAPGTQRALERTASAPGTERALERTPS